MRFCTEKAEHGRVVKDRRSKAKWILIDTDVWVSLSLKNDPNHLRAKKIVTGLRKREEQVFITREIIGETATVLSYKSGQDTARKFLNFAKDPDGNDFINLHIKHKHFIQALQLFEAQQKKGTSYVDCLNVVVMRVFELDLILSFDKVYHKKFGLDNIAYPTKKVA